MGALHAVTFFGGADPAADDRVGVETLISRTVDCRCRFICGCLSNFQFAAAAEWFMHRATTVARI
jgi:hypothetical protein